MQILYYQCKNNLLPKLPTEIIISHSSVVPGDTVPAGGKENMVWLLVSLLLLGAGPPS